MKYIVIIGLSIFFLSWGVCAEKVYVNTDNIVPELRTGPAFNKKISQMLTIGQRLEVLSEKKNWTQVRLQDGKTGWVHNSYIDKEVPSSILLKLLQQRYETMVRDAAPNLKALVQLKDENQNLLKNLQEKESVLETMTNEFNQLKEESAEYLSIKKKHDAAQDELATQSQKLLELEESLKNIAFSSGIRWFLSGAGVLVIGIIIGTFSKKNKRRSSLL